MFLECVMSISYLSLSQFFLDTLVVGCFFHRDVIVTAGFWDGFDDDVEDLLTPQTETPKNLGDANR